MDKLGYNLQKVLKKDKVMDAQTRILWLLKKLNRGEIINTAQDELLSYG